MIDFDGMETDASPHGFTIAVTGEGGSASWLIQQQDSEENMTNALVQTSSESENYRFPVCIYDDVDATDVDVSVKFKPMTGEIDQAAGLVWRYQDADNYYVVRANALEDNVVLYKMQNGKRSDIKPVGSGFFSYGKKAPVPVNEWSTLRVIVTGNTFAVWLNGAHLYDVENETFQGAGKVGLWTKADSVTAFDDLTITRLDNE